ncbi:isocitrate lyase/PEP mutase family protein [Nisaea acidiphila]|uniref:Isocitrate lyase/PEP mutase family protein n=1 Tax=Nisaea acidiphila TaxID=1862145 RepID=A0A9J7AYE1_9PROT|nr:isocitrate lyase/PEP mutase family protein [Nisaea acidiphila]UUX50453.1 isocitrate lyase/PEP mutase family protein [Nisaea acidiphila]
MKQAKALRERLAGERILTIPGCFDAMSAKLVEKAGFEAAYVSGYAVSATQIGLPDAGLLSYKEILDQARDIAGAVSLPLIGDADTGFGNPVNVRRTVRGFADAGIACVMLEDQVFPKRCGFAKGVEVVSRDEATIRLRAALDMRDEIRAEGGDILILARTDSRVADGLDEALWRCEAFADMGADIVYFEGPQERSEMEQLCRRVPAPKLLAQLEREGRPLLTPVEAEEIGYDCLLFGVTLLNVSIRAMRDALALIAGGAHPGSDRLMAFEELYETVGFDWYYELEKRYGPGR